MGQSAAKQGDRITGQDTHNVPGTPNPVPVVVPFSGILDGGLSTNVRIGGRFAAVVGSTATNTPPHVAPSGSFVVPPTNRGTVKNGSTSVRINGKAAARNSDIAETCNDPAPLPIGTVVATGTVRIGG